MATDSHRRQTAIAALARIAMGRMWYQRGRWRLFLRDVVEPMTVGDFLNQPGSFTMTFANPNPEPTYREEVRRWTLPVVDLLPDFDPADWVLQFGTVHLPAGSLGRVDALHHSLEGLERVTADASRGTP